MHMALIPIGTTHHITSEFNNLSVRDAYRGHEKVNTAGGQVWTYVILVIQ
jgi:hypothetical protein